MITTEALRASSYEGWVAWLKDGSPIFEAVPFLPKLKQAIAGGLEFAYRKESRNTMDWIKVPFKQIDRLELYFDRSAGRPQPAIMLAREPNAELRFFQMKMGSLVVSAGINVLGNDGNGQMRTGIVGYRIGYYNEQLQFSQMWEIRRGVKQIKEYPVVGHPCWPRPHGYGLNPVVVGLTDGDVPPLPSNRAVGA